MLYDCGCSKLKNMKIEGLYNTAVVMTENIDESAHLQIKRLCDQEIFENSRIRIMPDCHAGMGCVIGFTANLKNKVIPNLVGVDISCSISTYKLDAIEIDFAKLDHFLKFNLPHGESVRRSISPLVGEELQERVLETGREILSTPELSQRDLRSIGSLGGGNHFLEVNRDKSGSLWFSIHCGSRNFGHRICSFHQNNAIPSETIPKPLWYIEGEEMQMYTKHVKVAQDFAKLNHGVILDEVCNAMGWNVIDKIFTNHNYIEFLDNDEILIRKGAISAKEGERVIIPMNMRDGSFIGVGKGNPDWNNSAPHGAGRILSRKEARENLKMEEFKEEMKDVWTTCVRQATIDEAPMAYKPMSETIDNIGDSVDILDRIIPVYNFKA